MKNSIQSQDANKGRYPISLCVRHHIENKNQIVRELYITLKGRMGRAINIKALNRKSMQIHEMVIWAVKSLMRIGKSL